MDKRGGICFRVDDNQPIQKWTDYAAIFNKYGYKFCAALCPGRMVGNDEYPALGVVIMDGAQGTTWRMRVSQG